MSIESLITHYGLVAVFLGAGFEGETSVVTGGLLAHQHLLPLVPTGVAAATGSFVADQLFFLAGRRYRDTARVRRMTTKPAFARALAALDRRPTAFLLGFRFLLGLRTISPIAIGTSHVPARTFVLLNAIAAVLWATLFTAIGYLFGDRMLALLGNGHNRLIEIAVLVAIAATIGLGVRLWHRRHPA
ncbi:DedA family protein [Sphingomonas sp. PB2P19]|uniref:DedA family protein n=1 Tax=Sphingomonas rhamnosi TaxID=3096156 RepID=UPI002FC9208E